MSHEAKQVARVVSRLTRERMTTDEVRVVAALYPGKRATWLPASSRRFLRDVMRRAATQWPIDLSYAQRRWLWSLAVDYRWKLPDDLALKAWPNLRAYPRLRSQGLTNG